MRAVYTEFFSHYSEERVTSLLSEASQEAAGLEDGEATSGGVDLLAYEELIKEAVPGFSYVGYMQCIANQIGHQFTFLRVRFLSFLPNQLYFLEYVFFFLNEYVFG
jgi:hypothetical protein